MRPRLVPAPWLLGAVVVFAAAAIMSSHFWFVDACLDAGGVVPGYSWSCSEPRAQEYRAISDRPLSFWLLVVIPPAFLAVLVGTVLRRILGARNAT